MKQEEFVTKETITESSKKKKIWLAAGIVAGLFLVTGIICYGVHCRRTGPEAFEAYTEQLFKDEIVLNTINLHYTLAYPENYGITDYEVSLGTYSVSDFEESYREMEKLQKELRKFNPRRLKKEQRLTYDILMDYLETELATKDMMLYTETLSSATGYQAQLPVVLAEYTFRTRADIEDYLKLASQVDDIAEDIIAFEKEKAAAGLFMADYVADGVIAQCEEFIANPQENYMLEVFDDKIEAFKGLTKEEKEDYKEKNYEVITTDVVEAYEILITGLKELKGSGTNELGLCYYEDGKEYYEYLVKTSTGSSDSVKKLERRIEKYLEEYILLLQKEIIENPELYDELLFYEFPDMEPEEMMEDLMQKANEDFPKPPEVNYTIKTVHSSMQDNMSPAFYLTTPIDDLAHNIIYINKKHLNEESAMSLYPTMAHEGYPGHLYQNIYTGSCNLPLVRNLFSYPGYTEGWATYVEYEYAYQMSGADGVLEELLAGNAGTSLAISAYLDMKIHYDGWNREDVFSYLEGLGLADEETVDEMFQIIVEEPANYLSYFVGYLEFMDLRERAEKKLGNHFEIKEFHEFLLRTGPAPFYIIEDYMNDWIKEQKEGK